MPFGMNARHRLSIKIVAQIVDAGLQWTLEHAIIHQKQVIKVLKQTIHQRVREE